MGYTCARKMEIFPQVAQKGCPCGPLKVKRQNESGNERRFTDAGNPAGGLFQHLAGLAISLSTRAA